jgi:hypothetical protein
VSETTVPEEGGERFGRAAVDGGSAGAAFVESRTEAESVFPPHHHTTTRTTTAVRSSSYR